MLGRPPCKLIENDYIKEYMLSICGAMLVSTHTHTHNVSSEKAYDEALKNKVNGAIF